MELYIIRHAQSTNNALVNQRERVQDPELTELGQRQAQNLAEHLAEGIHPEMTIGISEEDTTTRRKQGYGINRLYCSAMKRAMQTARPVGEALKLSTEVWIDIHEVGGIYLDDFETETKVGYPGQTRPEIMAEFPNFVLPGEVTDEGWWNKGYEDWPGCHGRAIRVARQLHRLAEQLTHERIAIVTHGGFIDALLKALLNQSPSPIFFFHHYNTAITRIDFLPDKRLHFRHINRVNHIPMDMIS